MPLMCEYIVCLRRRRISLSHVQEYKEAKKNKIEDGKGAGRGGSDQVISHSARVSHHPKFQAYFVLPTISHKTCIMK